MNKFNTSLIAVVITGSLFTFTAQSAVDPSVFGDSYQPVASVPVSQSQVIYYHETQSAVKDAAHVYVDGEYQSALLPGMFTTFCIAPGNHSLGSFQNDAPHYKGKEAQPYRDTFVGGKTYFMKVEAGKDGRPQMVNAQQARQELKPLRSQAHTLNRASAVEQCRYTEQASMDYALSSDVLFNFGKASRNDISAQGRQAISELVGKLQKDGVHLNRIQVIGHTDPIGKPATNLQLGQQRANTVRLLLAEGGLPLKNLSASSAGSQEPVINECSGTREERIQCNAPNRRVVVRVDAAQ